MLGLKGEIEWDCGVLKYFFYGIVSALALVGALMIVAVLSVAFWLSSQPSLDRLWSSDAEDFDLERDHVLVFSMRNLTSSPPLAGGAFEGPVFGGFWGAEAAPLDPLRFYEALSLAADDSNVRALALRFDVRHLPSSYLPATAQQITEALERFRQSGKPIWLYAEDFFGSNASTALIPAAVDRFWIAPEGFVSLTGYNLPSLLFGDFFEEWGVDMQVEQRHEYKSGGDSLSRSRFQPEARRNMQELVDDLWAQLSTRMESIAWNGVARFDTLSEEFGVLRCF